MKTLTQTLSDTAKLVSSQRMLWLPFALVACVETFFLGFVWLAPHAPYSSLLAPPIRYFFGDRVLHYPMHLWFLYHVMEHTHFFASTIVGAYLTGIACVMVKQVHSHAPLSFRDALVGRNVRYVRVVALWLISWGLAKGMVAGLSEYAPRSVWMAWTSIGLAVVLQALLVYAIPAAVFENASWWKALRSSLREAVRYPVTTLIVVLIPSAALIAFAILAPSARVGAWVVRSSTPELVVALIATRLVLWTLADAVMTVMVAHLWWLRRAVREEAPAEVAKMTATYRLPPRAVVTVALMAIAALMLSGCSASYHGERLFWKAQQISAPISKAPTQATPAQFAKAIAAFERVVQKAPGTVWAARAQLAVGSLYSLQKQFDNARDAYVLVRQNYNNHQDLVLNSRVATAKTYEAEKQWDEAVKAYQEIAEYHTWTTIGLESPLYVGILYKHLGKTAEASEAIQRALRNYTKLLPDAPNPNATSQVKGYMAQAHLQLGEWEQAAAILEELLKAPGVINRPLTLLTLGSLYESRLHDPKRAEEFYTQLIKESPDHQLASLAKKQLQHMGVQLPEEPAKTVTPPPPAAPPAPPSR